MDDNKWKHSGNKYGVAIVNFKGDCRHGLPLQIGETVHILEEFGSGSTGWYRGESLRHRGHTGIFPISFVHIKPCVIESDGHLETIIPIEDPTVKDVNFYLREWWRKWKKLFKKEGCTHGLREVKKIMENLLQYRSKFVNAALSSEQKKEVQQDIAKLLDIGNNKLRMDMIPRVDGEPVNPDTCSVVELYRIHVDSEEMFETVPKSRRSRSQSEGRLRISNELNAVGQNHILVNFSSCQFIANEESQVYLSIYDATNQKFISEQFEISLSKHGMVVNAERLNESFGLFTELSDDDLGHNSFIVIKIFRCGKMLNTNNSKDDGKMYRRPLGVGVLKIEEIKHMSNPDEMYETTVKIYSCVENEILFPELHKNLIKQAQPSTKLLVPNLRDKEDKGLAITFQFTILNGDLQSLLSDNVHLFHRNVTLVPKLSFTDLIINPDTDRNDIYLTLEKAEFERGKKKAEKNVEICVTAVNSTGQQIENCFCFGCGGSLQNSFTSTIYYHNNSPKWYDTVRISMKMEQLPNSFIRFDLYHCSTRGRGEKKLFGFCFLRVTDQSNIVIADKSHNLAVYQCDDLNKVNFIKFKELPYLNNNIEDPRMSIIGGSPDKSLPYKRRPSEFLSVKTQLCSTRYTQTTDLLGLLQWKSNTNNLESMLEAVLSVEAVEIMKFLGDVLDQLFAILGDCASCLKEYHYKATEVLCFVVKLLEENRYVAFKPVLEKYITEKFSSPLAYRDLLKVLSKSVFSYIDGSKICNIQMAFTVLDTLMKFVVRSVQLANPLLPNETEFKVRQLKEGIHHLFQSFCTLLSSTTANLKPSQMTLLSNLHKVYTPLKEVMSQKEIAMLVHTVIMGMPKLKDLPDDVQRNKLIFIQKTINSSLFDTSESRAIILPMCISQIKSCLIEKCHLPKATSILGDILANMFDMKQTMDLEEDIRLLTTSIFEVILQTVLQNSDQKFMFSETASSDSREISPASRNARIPSLVGAIVAPIDSFLTGPEVVSSSRADTQPGELVSCVTDMLRLMDNSHYQNLIDMYRERAPLKDFLERVFCTFRELIKPSVFNKNWTLMRLVTNNVIFTATEYFADALHKHFLEGDDFDQVLWQQYFNLAVAFITQPSLQLEKMSEAKRQKIKERYQDMRRLMSVQMQGLWEILGNNQFLFIPSLIGPFLEVSLVPEEEVRKSMLLMFFDMMKCEQRLNGNFAMVENEMIEKLDLFITTKAMGDPKYLELFQTILLDKVQTEPALKENGSQFILSVTNLLEKLLDYRSVYDSSDDNEGRKKQCTFNILNFYKSNSNRQKMYMQYLKKLYELQYSANNYVEAGLTLELIAKLHGWSDEIKESELGFPTQLEWERKENLYYKVIDCFDQGNVWEYGIPLLKDLAEFYEEKLMFKNLASVLERQASFYNKILDGIEVKDGTETQHYPRQEPSYYRVSYYGRNFPPFVRNKVFIYRGEYGLKLSDIIQQLKQEFPACEILNNNVKITDEHRNGENLLIQVCNVKPVSEERPEFKKNPGAAPQIKNFYNANDVDTFLFDKSFYNGEKDKENEFKNLCTERTLMKTNYKFPGIMQWYEVVSMEQQVLSPLQTAIKDVTSASSRLSETILETRANCTEDNIKQLSMNLQGMISANVQGGIPKYQELFFSSSFAKEHPEEVPQQEEFAEVLRRQVELLDEGLKVLKSSGQKTIEGMIKNLEGLLADLKTSVGIQKNAHRWSNCSDIGNFGYHSNIGNSNRSINSIQSNASAGSSDTSQEEGVYMDPEDFLEELPAIQTTKSPSKFLLGSRKRHTQFFTQGNSLLSAQSNSSNAPNIPSRPLSLCLNKGAKQHKLKRHESDTCVKIYSKQDENKNPTPCKSLSSSNLGYISPSHPPIPVPRVTSNAALSCNNSTNVPRKTSTSSETSISCEVNSAPRANIPPVPPKTAKPSIPKKSASSSGLLPSANFPPVVPPRGRSGSSSGVQATNVNHLTERRGSVSQETKANSTPEYKDLSVTSALEPPPLPVRKSRTSSSSGSSPPFVSPRSSLASSNRSSMSEQDSNM